jgi:hypothetical protein
LKKRTKKLLFVGFARAHAKRRATDEGFCFSFQRAFLAFFSTRNRPRPLSARPIRLRDTPSEQIAPRRTGVPIPGRAMCPYGYTIGHSAPAPDAHPRPGATIAQHVANRSGADDFPWHGF